MKKSTSCVYELHSSKLEVRERIFTKGSSQVSNTELLAALIGTGIKNKPVLNLANEVLALCEQQKDTMDPKMLKKIKGMGTAQACRVLAAFELGKRFYGNTQKIVHDPEDIWEAIKHLADSTRERFIVCTLNGAQAIINVHIVSVGILNKTIVHPREVFAEAIKDRACAIVVAHNHPSGKMTASDDDIEITRRLKESGEILGIPLLDHLIFSDRDFISLLQQGCMLQA